MANATTTATTIATTILIECNGCRYDDESTTMHRDDNSNNDDNNDNTNNNNNINMYLDVAYRRTICMYVMDRTCNVCASGRVMHTSCTKFSICE